MCRFEGFFEEVWLLLLIVVVELIDDLLVFWYAAEWLGIGFLVVFVVDIEGLFVVGECVMFLYLLVCLVVYCLALL